MKRPLQTRRATFARSQPQHLHLMPKGSRTRRLCGATEGGYARITERAWIRKFLRTGGGLCEACRNAATETAPEIFP